jgi:hypothetical protein
MTGPRIPFAQRFWPKVDKRGPDDCWLWTGSKDGRGYGKIRADGPIRFVMKAHRAAFELTHGPIPDGLHVLHKCDRPGCTNPAHLRLGTHRENMNDMLERGRARGGGVRGERNGFAKLTEAQVREIRAAAAAGSSTSKLARCYGVDPSNIRYIVARRWWAHVL